MRDSYRPRAGYYTRDRNDTRWPVPKTASSRRSQSPTTAPLRGRASSRTPMAWASNGLTRPTLWRGLTMPRGSGPSVRRPRACDQQLCPGLHFEPCVPLRLWHTVGRHLPCQVTPWHVPVADQWRMICESCRCTSYATIMVRSRGPVRIHSVRGPQVRRTLSWPFSPAPVSDA